jgi:hypothetical protein
MLLSGRVGNALMQLNDSSIVRGVRECQILIHDALLIETDAFLHFGGRKSHHLITVSTISSHGDWLSYFTNLRSNSLNRINHSWISWALLKLTACRRKKVTRFGLSVASIQSAKPPIYSTSSSLEAWRLPVGVRTWRFEDDRSGA